MSTLGQRLVLLREMCAGKRGQRAFSRMVGVKQQSISNYERGSIPSARVVSRIIHKTGCSADWLLMGKGSMFPGGAPVRPEPPTLPITFRDENGLEVTPNSLAHRLGQDPKTIKKFLEDASTSYSAHAGLPLVVMGRDGEAALVYPESEATVGSRLEEAMLIETEILDEQLVIKIPSHLLTKYQLRVVSDTTIDPWPVRMKGSNPAVSVGRGKKGASEDTQQKPSSREPATTAASKTRKRTKRATTSQDGTTGNAPQGKTTSRRGATAPAGEGRAVKSRSKRTR